MPTLTAVTLSADELAAVDAFWQQRIYFNGKPLRRWEVLPRLAVSGGMTQRAAFRHLVTAEIVGQPVVAFDDTKDDGGWRTTKSGHTIHIGEDGEPDKGNPNVLRKLAGHLGTAAAAAGKAVAGVAGKAVKGGLKLAGKAAGAAARGAVAVGKEAVVSGAEILKNNVKETARQGSNLMEEAVRSGPGLALKAAKTGVKAAVGAAKVGVGAVKAGIGAAKTVNKIAKGGYNLVGKAIRKIGFAIERDLAGVWAKVTAVKMSPQTRRAVSAHFAA